MMTCNEKVSTDRKRLIDGTVCERDLHINGMPSMLAFRNLIAFARSVTETKPDVNRNRSGPGLEQFPVRGTKVLGLTAALKSGVDMIQRLSLIRTISMTQRKIRLARSMALVENNAQVHHFLSFFEEWIRVCRVFPNTGAAWPGQNTSGRGQE